MKNNKNYHYLCLILSIILLLVGIFFYKKSYDTKTGSFFTENSSIEYEVCLKENDFYKDKCLAKDKEYLASLTNEIRATIKYERVHDRRTDTKFKYYVDSSLIIYNRDNNKEIYVDSNKLVDEKEINENKEVNSILENVNINFDYYKAIADKYMFDYSINARAELSISMVLIENEVETKVATMVIPLLETTYSITEDLLEKKIDEAVDSKAKNYIFVSTLVIVLSILLFVITLYRLLTKFKGTVFEQEVNRLLTDYDRVIVESKGDNILLDNKQLIDLENFIELVDVRDTLEKPIVYVRKNDYVRDFLVQDSDVVYRYRMTDKIKER